LLASDSVEFRHREGDREEGKRERGEEEKGRLTSWWFDAKRSFVFPMQFFNSEGVTIDCFVFFSTTSRK